MADVLRLSREHSATLLTLNRPERRNALSHELIRALTAAIHGIERDEQTRCVIITGAPPAFCAGLDLDEVARQTGAPPAHDTSALLALYESIEELDKPVIAAVNGPAMAGGAGLVTACDLAIFANSATIGYPGIRQGLVAPIVMPGLVRLVGERHAKHLLLTGEPISATRALEIGLANEVVPDDELCTRARKLAESLALVSPQALAETKRLIVEIRRLTAVDARDGLRRLCSAVPLDDEARKALSGFIRR